MEKYVCNLEHSIKLKELGVKQESCFYWITDLRNEAVLARYSNSKTKVSAFLVGELGEMLPDFDIITEKFGEYWYCEYKKNEILNYRIAEDTEANARASMLEYLIENKLMEE